MIRKKMVANKGKGKAMDSSFGQGDELVREMEEEKEMIANPERGRAKKRTPAEVKSANQKKWEDGLRAKGFKNDRHVDVDNLGLENLFVHRIREQGLSYYLAPNPGYNKELEIEFYQKMKILYVEDEKKDDAKITSKIGKVPIEVTSGFIARVLNYCRPPTNEVNYPREEYVFDDTVIWELYKVPNQASLPHVPGKVKDDFRLVNQFVHHNLNPRGTENKPDIQEGGLIHAFMNPNMVCDWVEFIFQQLFDFKDRAPTNSRMPFPCLMTAICFAQKVPKSKFMEREKLNPGDINSSILTKSISQS